MKARTGREKGRHLCVQKIAEGKISVYARCELILFGPQSRFGDKRLRIWLVCPHNGSAVLKGKVKVMDKKIK